MVPMTFIWWIYHFWARFWPYFNFVDFQAYFGPFSLVNRDRQKMADLQRKMASNHKMQENKPTLKFNFTIEKRWPVLIFELFGPVSSFKIFILTFSLSPTERVLYSFDFSLICTFLNPKINNSDLHSRGAGTSGPRYFRRRAKQPAATWTQIDHVLSTLTCPASFNFSSRPLSCTS